MTIMGVVYRRIAGLFTKKQESNVISFFEVKELYNAAYEEKAAARNALRRYKRIEAKAKEMDHAYRAQLAANGNVRHKAA